MVSWKICAAALTRCPHLSEWLRQKWAWLHNTECYLCRNRDEGLIRAPLLHVREQNAKKVLPLVHGVLCHARQAACNPKVSGVTEIVSCLATCMAYCPRVLRKHATLGIGIHCFHLLLIGIGFFITVISKRFSMMTVKCSYLESLSAERSENPGRSLPPRSRRKSFTVNIMSSPRVPNNCMEDFFASRLMSATLLFALKKPDFPFSKLKTLQMVRICCMELWHSQNCSISRWPIN